MAIRLSKISKSRKLHMYLVEFIGDIVQVYTIKDIHSSHCFIIFTAEKSMKFLTFHTFKVISSGGG
jgi:hypothetical protein